MSENLLDLGVIRTFIEIADAGSISAGARRVFRTQSTASAQLQNLEATVGVRLLERNTRALSLTAEGERFKSYALKLLALNHEALASVSSGRERQPFRIGLSEYFEPEAMPHLFQRLQQLYPEYLIELRIGQSSNLLHAFEENALDLAIVTSRTAVSGAKKLRSETLSWVASSDFSTSTHTALPLVLLPADCPLHSTAIKALDKAKLPYRIAMTCSGSAGLLASIRGGVGIGCLNENAIPGDFMRLTGPRFPALPQIHFYLLMHKNGPAQKIAKTLTAV